MHQVLSAGERAVDDVDVVDFGSAEEQSKADVPRCLFAGAEDGDRVDGCAAFEDEG